MIYYVKCHGFCYLEGEALDKLMKDSPNSQLYLELLERRNFRQAHRTMGLFEAAKFTTWRKLWQFVNRCFWYNYICSNRNISKVCCLGLAKNILNANKSLFLVHVRQDIMSPNGQLSLHKGTAIHRPSIRPVIKNRCTNLNRST